MNTRKSISCGLLLLVVSFNFSFSSASIAKPCELEKCRLPECRCSSTQIPVDLSPKQTPQFVLFTLDDAVSVTNYDFYVNAFENRTNTDGCPVAATFFVSHEYTNYQLVHNLYKSGHEIALHSITHNVSTDYWRSISIENLTAEFGGERQLISHFANISSSSLQGIRLPFLQMSGDNSFEMMYREKFLYDSSWPSQLQTSPGIWPYTLDYKSSQDCVIGPCPQQNYSSVWVLPMLTWFDQKNIPCSMVDTCVNVPEKIDEMVEWMIGNFNQSYHTNRAPFGFYVHAAWFNVSELHYEAYTRFIDYLQKLSDVYLVGASDVIRWVQKPVSVKQMKNSSWSKCRKPLKPSCQPRVCRLKKGTEDHYVTICGEACPNSYPWVGNPLGDL